MYSKNASDWVLEPKCVRRYLVQDDPCVPEPTKLDIYIYNINHISNIVIIKSICPAK